MDFWKIENSENVVEIKWSHNCFEDYKNLALDFYDCGYKTFEEVIDSGHDNVKSDMWFLAGIFLLRQSIELGLKALIVEYVTIKSVFKKYLKDVAMIYLCFLRTITMLEMKNF